ncbi:MAG: N-6 DNA methylase [Opitutus sp.]|nr:N-6 DNA methylase [Opitutus sp.]
MLDTDTKRRIDTARNILVGKVPDPKSQVEQITIALIYKFMDDMDAEAEELGGKRKFFTKQFARFGWAQLMRPGLGGHEVLALYAEGITRMPENPGIPPLFRDIFKNAYLPYRDPETLKAFLKIIHEFTYDHSERLGDAFEYLLSVLGTQADAGQFRTPRHIIDFIVDVVQPRKNEVVLDPACGTAGFLISAYKHILRTNRDAKGHSKLTPDDRGRLAKNFRGYDISPDMVRLSLVNLYLHGFTDPHILEYDTLTSEERWTETADVILANPPFMSPKGGIKPHKRFSVQSKRSEVLFVDYMAEHLTEKGRAGIIVPEGVIFQSQNSYVELRRMLVENSLVAVISLPAGVFQPYSGVKTSILILDRALAKLAKTIAFFKVENDGFGLGAQRREIEANDLPQVQAELADYLAALRNGRATEELAPTKGLIVAKDKITANGDFNLSGERYRDADVSNQQFPQVELGTICKPEYGFTASAEEKGNARFVRITDIAPDGRIKKDEPKFVTLTSESRPYLLSKGDLLVARTGATFGKTMLFDENYPAVFASYLIRLRFPEDKLLPEFYWSFAQSERYWAQARNLATGGGQPQFNGNALTRVRIPVPPLEVQKEIVAEIEGYQKVINGARAVLDHYHPHIPIDPAWPVVKLGDLFATKSGTTPSRRIAAYFSDGTIPWVKTLDLTDGPVLFTDEKITELALRETHLSILPAGTVLVAMYGGFNQIGRTGVLEIKATHNQAMTALLPCGEVDPYFLNAVLTGKKDHWKKVANSTRKDPNIKKTDVLNFELPLPPIATQRAIVAEIEAEQKLVAANRELITRFEQKIQATLARIWGEEKPASTVTYPEPAPAARLVAESPA